MRLWLAMIALAANSAALSAEPAKVSRLGQDWHRVATRGDLRRLHDWRDAFMQGLAAARAAGFSRTIMSEGALLVPDGPVERVTLRAGQYRCRTIQLGARDRRSSAYVANPPFVCRVTDKGEAQGFVQQGGMQRATGLLYGDSDRRRVFLGTLMLGDESRAMPYGQDDDRDVVGLLEQVGSARWRVILPYPRFESTVDVVELLPAN